jgi:hypothetical protein
MNDLRVLMMVLPTSTLGVRDAMLPLRRFAGVFRRSELVTLEV